MKMQMQHKLPSQPDGRLGPFGPWLTAGPVVAH